MKTVALREGRLMVGGALDHAADPVARGIERLAVQVAVSQRIGADGHLDLVDHEALDLVYVEALVDPGHKQCFRALGLSADLATLPHPDGGGVRQQRKDPQGELGDRRRSSRAPAPDADIRLDLELLPPARRHRKSPSRDWRMATIAGPAVSVRRIRWPSETTVTPAARAASTSVRASPPSGPTMTVAVPGAPAAPRTEPSGSPPPSQRHSVRSAAWPRHSD